MNVKHKAESNDPVIIVGAGLAGLACAQTLQKRGINFLLLEQAAEVGGRLKSFTTPEGYLVDHGFQVVLTSYPELKLLLDLKKLKLKPFNSGSLVYTPGGNKLLANPLVHPAHLLTSIFSSLATIKDKFLVLQLIMKAKFDVTSDLKNITTIDYLYQFGFSEKFIKLFWHPFLSGVLLDPDLNISADFFLFLVKSFSSGRACVPSFGMQEIPRQMAAQLDSASIRLNVSVKEVTSNFVVLSTSEKIPAKKVIVAYNQSGDANKFLGVQNYYFTTSEQLPWDRWLLLVPPEFGFNILTVVIINKVAPNYGIESSENLLSVSVVDPKGVSVEKLKEELRKIAKRSLNDLRFIKSFEIPNALPKMRQVNDKDFDIVNNIYYIGDYTTSPSINGALRSGRLVAESIAGMEGA